MKRIFYTLPVLLSFSLAYAADPPPPLSAPAPVPPPLASDPAEAALRAARDAAYIELQNGALGKVLQGIVYDPDPAVRRWVWPDSLPAPRGLIDTDRNGNIVIRDGFTAIRPDGVYLMIIDAVPLTGSLADRQAAADQVDRMWARIRADMERYAMARRALDTHLRVHASPVPPPLSLSITPPPSSSSVPGRLPPKPPKPRIPPRRLPRLR